MLEIVRFFCGFVEFAIYGRFPERFINIVTNNGFPLWGVKKDGDKMYACMYAKDYKRMRKFAKKSSVRLKTQKKCGLPFFLKKNKNRVGVVAGALCFVLVVLFMSNFVWTIDVVGLETVSYTHVMSVLKENGLYVGTFKPRVSFPQIGRNTQLEIDDIGWMSVNVLGTHASVEIKEKAKSPFVEDVSTPANVKAKCDGQIISINTANGEALFSAGSAVVKDQMLVGGVLKDKLGGVKLVRASAEVIAKTTHKETFTLNKNFEQTAFIEGDTSKSVEIFSLCFPYSYAFYDEKNSYIKNETRSACLFDAFLPLRVTTQKVYDKDKKNVMLSEKTANSILENNALLYECFSLQNCDVSNRDFKIVASKNQYILEATFNTIEDIAYQSDIDASRMVVEEKEKGDKEAK